MNREEHFISDGHRMFKKAIIEWNGIAQNEVNDFIEQAQDKLFDTMYQYQKVSISLSFVVSKALVDAITNTPPVKMEAEKVTTLLGFPVEVVNGKEMFARLYIVFD